MRFVIPIVLLAALSLGALVAGPGCQTEPPTGVIAPAVYADIAERLRADGLRREQAFTFLTDLTPAISELCHCPEV